MSHRHIDPMDRNDTYGMPSRPCIVCRRECCTDCAEPRPTTDDPRALLCWDCVENERAEAEERRFVVDVETAARIEDRLATPRKPNEALRALWSGCPFCNAPIDKPHKAGCRYPEADRP